jgi:hypothetical protein
MQKRIVCTEKSTSTTHGHITTVGIGSDADKADTSETVDEVRRNILFGTDTYYTLDVRSGKRADVERFDCWCGVKTIRSNPDAVTDNNLDKLRKCSWAA